MLILNENTNMSIQIDEIAAFVMVAISKVDATVDQTFFFAWNSINIDYKEHENLYIDVVLGSAAQFNNS
jgi:hypothetical protein